MYGVRLVRAIVQMVARQGAARNARRATRVKFRFNPLTSHSADHVRFSFDIVSQDSSLVKDGKLKLNEAEPLWLCSQCGNRFPGQHPPDVCPQCAAVDVKAVKPTDLVLESLEIEH